MSYGHLLKTQANDVLNAVTKNGLNPQDFAWEVETTTTLRYTPSGDYFFTFARAEHGSHEADYCPGKDIANAKDYGGSWAGQLKLFGSWLTNIKREIQAPDLWSLLSEHTALVQAASADSANTPFSAAEIEKISDGLRELQAYIENTHHLDEQKHAFLESRLVYLEDAAHR